MADKSGMAWFGPGHSPLRDRDVVINGLTLKVSIDGKVPLGHVALSKETLRSIGLVVDDIVVPEFAWSTKEK